jgi:DNA-binding LacI/PurR family transcriptional regulator
VAFGQRPGSPGWNRFWDAICREVQRRDADDEPEGPDAARKFPVFFGVTGEPHNKPYRDLRRQVRSGRVAGLIVVGTTDFQMMQMPELIDGRLPLPRVTIFAKPVADVPTVTIDHDSFIRRSLDAVQQAGSRTVAVLTADNDSFCGYAKAITSRGLKTKPYWHFEASAKGARGVQNLVHLLLDRPPKDRPDALIITDDNLVEAALAGVVASRTVVPDDLCIVTHCNWPEPVTRVLPVTRLGFDVRQVLDRCIDCLDRQREGTTCDPITRVPPLTEREACSTRDRFRSSQTLLEVPR